MKKTRNIFIALTASFGMFLFISCSNKDSLPALELSSSDPFSVSINEAVLKASSFVESKGLLLPTKGASIDIKDAFTITSPEKLPIIHVINFNDGGFTLISADKRIEPILAFSEKGRFPFSSEDYPLGLKIWVDRVVNRIQSIHDNDIQQDEIYKQLWQQVSCDLINTRSVPIDTTLTPPDVEDREIGPLLSTQWHQCSPYNDGLPTVSYNGLSHTAYVGCGPLSIAQIMKYHEFPSSFSWNQMPNIATSPSSAISYLIHDIHDELYGSLTYSYNGTSLPPSFNFANCLKNTYGYSSATQSSYSYLNTSHREIILSNLLDYERPIIFIGFISNNSSVGHVWICDGVISNYIVYLDGGLYQVYNMIWYHHSWGMPDKSIDGWYLLDNYTVTDSESNTLNLGYNMKFVYDIIP